MTDFVEGVNLVGGTGVSISKSVIAGTRGDLASYTIAASPTLSGVKATVSAVAAIGSGAWTSVLWDTEEFDTDGYHSTASNTNRLTIPTGLGGKFLLLAVGDFASNATGIRGLQVTKNTATANTNVVLQWSSIAYAGISNAISAAGIIALADGDWLNVNVFQNSGGSLNFASFPSGAHFALYRIGA